MITLTPGINRNDGHVVADRKIDASGMDLAIPTTFATAIANAWMLAASYSILHYAVAVSLMRSNEATDAAFVSECRISGGDDEPAEMPNGSSNTFLDASLEELMATDRRRVECEALGTFESDLTKLLRSNFILASHIVC